MSLTYWLLGIADSHKQEGLILAFPSLFADSTWQSSELTQPYSLISDLVYIHSLIPVHSHPAHSVYKTGK